MWEIESFGDWCGSDGDVFALSSEVKHADIKQRRPSQVAGAERLRKDHSMLRSSVSAMLTYLASIYIYIGEDVKG